MTMDDVEEQWYRVRMLIVQSKLFRSPATVDELLEALEEFDRMMQEKGLVD
jgi:hypothetical protein